ncbi:two component, sigma54 specific, transcriptional regulator, Fis family protein [Enhygromyxa salina]|uniref:Two component, sigma54 specific, transcriptional regulator, Fis family protein n=1 Tax=Enhygromyxa salina TaxID=215803 RepID=A0A0C2CW62_9BACT|nr:sigma 54-interacting transcriptional regulator [Enhygromyxa salina]KIG15276.1 two component, sigma54 specific, transcriptional regulator, Fis family protein [Enhygromyxa salina]
MASKPTNADLTAPTSAAGGIKTARRAGQLRVRLLDGETAEFPLANGPTITFGRSRAADVVISDQSVSKVHFSLRVVDGGVELEDLGAKNGTWFAGRRVRRIVLARGDKFSAGSCAIELVEIGEVDVEVAADSECGLLFGESLPMRELFATLAKLAPTPLDMLVTGETGTGKELTARTIHDLSLRRDQPFVILDCSTLPSTLADASIFGFRRGAFTGAEHDQPGLFEQAHGGTLFIDEIGELSAELQVKFLRALDRRQVARLGEPGNMRTVDVRVVAATNRDLSAEVRNGRFREDLFHRVAHASLRLPPLRERGVDVIALAERFLDIVAADHGQRVSLADDAKTLMATHDWPGNVRELKNAIRRAAFVCRDHVIRSEDLSLGRPDGWGYKLAKALDDGKNHEYEDLHMLVDSIYLPAVMTECQSISASARRLGITRGRLRSRLQALGLHDVNDD